MYDQVQSLANKLSLVEADNVSLCKRLTRTEERVATLTEANTELREENKALNDNIIKMSDSHYALENRVLRAEAATSALALKLADTADRLEVIKRETNEVMKAHVSITEEKFVDKVTELETATIESNGIWENALYTSQAETETEMQKMRADFAETVKTTKDELKEWDKEQLSLLGVTLRASNAEEVEKAVESLEGKINKAIEHESLSSQAVLKAWSQSVIYEVLGARGSEMGGGEDEANTEQDNNTPEKPKKKGSLFKRFGKKSPPPSTTTTTTSSSPRTSTKA